MYERILVPLDGSETAEIVLPYCEEIAAKLGSEIVLVSVSESGEDLAGSSTYLESIVERVRNRLKEYGVSGDIKVHSQTLRGKPAVEILRYIDEFNADLIGMASLGASGQGPWFLGSIAAKVLRATSKPVLLVRAPVIEAVLRERRLVKRILLPLDGSELGEAAISFTEVLAQALGAELVLLHVIEPAVTWGIYQGYPAYRAPADMESRGASAMKYLDDKEKLLQEKGLRSSSIVVMGNPAENIVSYAAANAIDLIAMSTHGRTGVGRWVFGSITDKVLHTGSTAALVVRSAKVTERQTEGARVEEPSQAAGGRERVMRAYFLYTANGPLVILTSYDSVLNPKLLNRLDAKGIRKFIAYEVPVEQAKTKYGKHFEIVLQDLHETDDLRVLDYSGARAFESFRFSELGTPIYHELE